MRCELHRADGCAECKPAMSAAWTVGQLKSALAEIPDDTPLVANAADPNDPNVADEKVIVGAGFGTVDWGDGYGPECNGIFGLECEIPDGLLRTRPERPRRRAGNRPAGSGA